MYGLIIALFAAMFMTWGWSLTIPAETAFQHRVRTDVAGVNFWSYQRTVSRYQHITKIIEGHIADSQLVFDIGHIRNNQWTNIVQGGVLYVYSASPIRDDVAGSILKKGGWSSVIGIAQSNGQFRSINQMSDGEITLPTVIPAGSIVVIGT